MPMIDPFLPSAFSLNTLTAAINNLKFVPGRLSAFFEEQGITTLDAAIEERDGVLSLVGIKPRSAPGQIVLGEARRIRTFRVPHIPEQANIMADEVQGIRAFGTENQAEVLTTRINERLATMRRNIDYTMEAHRLQAVLGKYYDANGDLQDLFATFGVSQQSQALGLSSSASSGIRGKMFAAIQKVRSALDGVPFSQPVVLCGDNFWMASLEDKDTKATYFNTPQASALRGNTDESYVAWGASWEWYRGTSAVKIPDNEAYLIPGGVPGLFITRFAPANYMETVNTVGLPYYAKSEPLDLGKGMMIEAQSNPLNLCTRPAAIIKLTIS